VEVEKKRMEWKWRRKGWSRSGEEKVGVKEGGKEEKKERAGKTG
jgi:hypothetical protein